MVCNKTFPFIWKAFSAWCVLLGRSKNHWNGFVGDYRWQVGRILLHSHVGIVHPWICYYCCHFLPVHSQIAIRIHLANGSKFGNCFRHWIKVNIEWFYWFCWETATIFVVYYCFQFCYDASHNQHTGWHGNRWSCHSFCHSGRCNSQHGWNCVVRSRRCHFYRPITKCWAVVWKISGCQVNCDTMRK